MAKQVVKWIVPVDGSVIAREAFEMALYLMTEEFDHELFVVHVNFPKAADAKKVPLMYQPEHIVGEYEQTCKQDLETRPNVSFNVEMLHPASSHTHIYDVLHDYILQKDPDFVVLGYFGAGQVRFDPSTGKRVLDAVNEKLGSVADRVTRVSPATAIVVKKGRPMPDEESGSKYMVAVDGSDASKIALSVVLHYFKSNCAGVKSEFRVVHFSKNDVKTPQDDLLSREYKHLLEEAKVEKPNVKCFPRNPNAAMNIGYDIGKEAERENVDFLILGSTGMSGAKPEALGSVANHCVRFAPCHAVVAKLSSKH